MLKILFEIRYRIYFMILFFAALVTASIQALSFGGAIESPKTAALLTIPSTLFGLIAFVFFIVNLFKQNNTPH